MKVCFVLPPHWGMGSGGYAVVYEYASRLKDRGHDTTVLHLDPPPSDVRAALAYVRRRLRLRVRPNPYATRSGMTVRSVRSLHSGMVREADALVATAWTTADPVHRAPTGARKAYFIQHYEVWDGAQVEIDRTWRLPLRRIVIATWLKQLAEELGATPVHHVPNAIDLDIFRVTRPIARRDVTRIGMLFSSADWKRSADGIAAVHEIRRRGTDATLAVFSAASKPSALPEWVEWHGRLTPAQVAALMNTLSIFVSPSAAEGWPLPPAEAMACGCALVTSDIGGVRDYAREGESARLYPAGDVTRLADVLTSLFSDDEQRQRLAVAGQHLISTEFSWARSVERFESVLLADDD